jgi:hypothetical protein
MKGKQIISLLLCIMLFVTGCSTQNDNTGIQDTIYNTELSAEVRVNIDGTISTGCVLSTEAPENVTQTSIVLPDEKYNITAEYDEIEDVSLVNGTTKKIQDTQNSTNTVESQVNSAESVTTVNNVVDMSSLPTVEQRISVQTQAHQYFYSTLTKKEQAVYDAIIKAVCNYEAVVTFTDVLDINEYSKILGIVYLQNPELFWLRGTIDLASDGKSANLYYLCTQDQVVSLEMFLNARVEQILAQMPVDATVLKKLQIIHDYICINTVFSKGSTTSKTALGPLVDGISQCEGYAKAFLYMCNVIEVPCLYISGTNDQGATHAWNVVNIDGEWYNVDCTWDDPIMKIPDAKNVSYQYFCVRDIDIQNITHFNINISQSGEDWTYFEAPKCTSLKQNIDYVYGVSASSYEEAYEKIREGMLDCVRTGKTVTHVKFTTQEVYLDAFEKLRNQKELLALKNEINAQLGYTKIISVATNKTNSLNYLAVTLTLSEE